MNSLTRARAQLGLQRSDSIDDLARQRGLLLQPLHVLAHHGQRHGEALGIDGRQLVDGRGEIVQRELDVIHPRGVDAVARAGDGVRQHGEKNVEPGRALRAAPQLEQRGLEHHHITHSVLRWSRSPRPAMMSMGSGKTIVVFFSTPISVSVCR